MRPNRSRARGADSLDRTRIGYVGAARSVAAHPGGFEPLLRGCQQLAVYIDRDNIAPSFEKMLYSGQPDAARCTSNQRRHYLLGIAMLGHRSGLGSLGLKGRNRWKCVRINYDVYQ